MKPCYFFKGKLPTQYGIYKDIFIYVMQCYIIARKKYKLKMKER